MNNFEQLKDLLNHTSNKYIDSDDVERINDSILNATTDTDFATSVCKTLNEMNETTYSTLVSCYEENPELAMQTVKESQAYKEAINSSSLYNNSLDYMNSVCLHIMANNKELPNQVYAALINCGLTTSDLMRTIENTAAKDLLQKKADTSAVSPELIDYFRNLGLSFNNTSAEVPSEPQSSVILNLFTRFDLPYDGDDTNSKYISYSPWHLDFAYNNVSDICILNRYMMEHTSKIHNLYLAVELIEHLTEQIYNTYDGNNSTLFDSLEKITKDPDSKAGRLFIYSATPKVSHAIENMLLSKTLADAQNEGNKPLSKEKMSEIFVPALQALSEGMKALEMLITESLYLPTQAHSLLIQHTMEENLSIVPYLHIYEKVKEIAHYRSEYQKRMPALVLALPQNVVVLDHYTEEPTPMKSLYEAMSKGYAMEDIKSIDDKNITEFLKSVGLDVAPDDIPLSSSYSYIRIEQAMEAAREERERLQENNQELD